MLFGSRATENYGRSFRSSDNPFALVKRPAVISESFIAKLIRAGFHALESKLAGIGIKGPYILMSLLHTASYFARTTLTVACVAMLSACVSTEPRNPVLTPKPRPIIIVPAPPRPATPMPTPSSSSGKTAPAQLEAEIQEAWRAFPGRTGVAVKRIDGEWLIGKRQSELFPQQSVSKMWVALTILDQVDRGQVKLDQMVRITRDDLTLFHQPIRARVIANGEINESVQSLLEQSILTSDCTANDSLLRTAGGSAAVRRFIASKSLGQIRFGPGERLLQSEVAGLVWQQSYSLGNAFFSARDALPYDRRKAALDRYLNDPVDGASPEAIVKALDRLAKGELLSPASTRLLLGMMERVTSGPNRLRAGVPSNWRFGHKTGTGQILSPVATGYNDIGIMTAPDGTRYAIAVMMADTTASVPQRMEMMQAVSRAIANWHR
jgi:beta-lactamase class A